MDRPYLIRGLRVAVSAVSGILCALQVALWVRSYFWSDSFMRYTSTQLIRFESQRGQIGAVATNRTLPSRRWVRLTRPANAELFGLTTVLFPRPRTLGFNPARNAKEIGVAVPLWFLVLLTAALALAPWIPWSKRWSLRTHLIATTFVALVLGLTAFSMR
jgi:hypothetical protein